MAKIERPCRAEFEGVACGGDVLDVEFRAASDDAAQEGVIERTEEGRVFLQNLSPLKRELLKRQIKKRIKAGDWVAGVERPQAP